MLCTASAMFCRPVHWFNMNSFSLFLPQKIGTKNTAIRTYLITLRKCKFLYQISSSFSFWRYRGQFMFHCCQFVMYYIYTPLVLSNPTQQVRQDPWHELCNHQSHKLQTESWEDKRNSVRILWNDLHVTKYRKIPQISSGAYIFQRLFLRGLYSKGLIYRGKFAYQNRVG